MYFIFFPPDLFFPHREHFVFLNSVPHLGVIAPYCAIFSVYFIELLYLSSVVIGFV